MVPAPQGGIGRRGYRPLVPAVVAYSSVVTANGFLAPLLLAMASDLGVSAAEVGQLVVFTALPRGLLAPVCSLLSDRLGRRPVLLVAPAGMGSRPSPGPSRRHSGRWPCRGS